MASTYNDDESPDPILDLIQPYVDLVRKGLDERWAALQPQVEIYESERFEVLIGLAARQATLSIHLAINPGTWTPHIAPLILRCMTDTHITLAWILKDPAPRSRQYILHGLGQDKLFIAHLEADKAQAGEFHGAVDRLIEAKQAWLAAQRHDFLTDVTLGSWSGLNVRKMAGEAECDSLYRFAYTPFSAGVHSMWNHVCIFNLKHCSNPLHKYHRVPWVPDLPLEPDYLFRSAKYVTRSFQALDDAFALAVPAELPAIWLARAFTTIARESEPDG